MIKKISVLALATLALGVQAEEVQLPDGRLVKLHETGTWSYGSKDRLLSTQDGREIRLRDDGTWEYTGSLAPAPVAGGSEVSRALLGDVLLTLKSLTVETARSSNHKNSRKKTETVFEVGLLNQGEANGIVALDESMLRVEDSSGREYKILEVSPQSLDLTAGDKTTLEVRVDGSPHWFTIKAMELHIALEDGEDVVLKGLMSDAKKRDL